jgi:hypothetical protein
MSAGHVFSFVLRSPGMGTKRGVLGKAPESATVAVPATRWR